MIILTHVLLETVHLVFYVKGMYNDDYLYFAYSIFAHVSVVVMLIIFNTGPRI